MKTLKRMALLIVSLIPKGKFSQITFYKHAKNSWLYVCMSEKYVTSEEAFLKIFPLAIRVSNFEFEMILMLDKQIEIVTVSDDAIHDVMNRTTDNEDLHKRMSTPQGHRESEDKDINEK
jgi:hypothetical protein